MSEETSDEQLEKPPLPGQLMLFDIARENSPEQDSTQKKPSRKGRRKAARQKDESQEAADETKAQKKAGPRSSKRRTQQATSKQPGRSTKKKKAAQKKRRRAAAKKSEPPEQSPVVEAQQAPETAALPAPPSSTPQEHLERMETIGLKWGAQLPKVGFGFWKVEQDQTAEVCYDAIKTGYRHLDCACDYGNEQEVGQGIAKAISDGLCDRDDLWVTSKLWNTYHAAEHVRPACERTLQDLGLEYLDLYLIHFPIAQRFVPFEKNYPPGWFFDPASPNPVIEEAAVPLSETWQAMEELAKSGLVGNIGICNVGTSQLRDLMCHASIRPAVLQVESHPYLTQDKLLRYCQQEKIAYTAFSPLGAQSYFSLGMADPSEAVMENPVVLEIAQATGRTVAQVLLRWGVQRGTAVIPKTSRADRMAENINVFDFELTDAQMAAISGLNQGRRFNDPGDFGEAAFNTFLPIYE